jgi:hypothetical protein
MLPLLNYKNGHFICQKIGPPELYRTLENPWRSTKVLDMYYARDLMVRQFT